jgi:hypothetical protein
MMLRQRLREHTSRVSLLGRVLLLVLCVVLVWYGLMIVLLACKVSPSTVNAISGYRDIYDFLADLDSNDISGTDRLIAGLAGLAAFLLFGWLAWIEIPRPYLARSSVALRDDPRGTVEARPRAIERAGELAALENPSVLQAQGRFGGSELTLNVEVRHARDLAGTLRDVQTRAIRSFRRHDLPGVPVNVTLTGYERKTRRELA